MIDEEKVEVSNVPGSDEVVEVATDEALTSGSEEVAV